MENIGDRLTQLLKNKGVTRYVVSEYTGISESTLSRIINKNSKPNIENCKLLANYFNVSEEWLLTGSGEKELMHKLLEPMSRYENQEINNKNDSSQKEIDNDISAVSRLAKMLDEAYEEIKSLRQELERKKNI